MGASVPSSTTWTKPFHEGKEDVNHHSSSENIQLIRQIMIHIDELLRDTSLSLQENKLSTSD